MYTYFKFIDVFLLGIEHITTRFSKNQRKQNVLQSMLPFHSNTSCVISNIIVTVLFHLKKEEWFLYVL